jgi:hypothetical protein
LFPLHFYVLVGEGLMAFAQYPDSIAAVISTGSPYTIDLGTVSPDDDQQLEKYRLQIFKRGNQPNARLRVNAYVADVLQGVSEDVLCSQIEDEYDATDNFYGWIVFTFNPRFNLNSAVATRFELELENYVYQADDTVFIAAVLDWPVTMGFNSSPGSVSSSPVALELYGAG